MVYYITPSLVFMFLMFTDGKSKIFDFNFIFETIVWSFYPAAVVFVLLKIKKYFPPLFWISSIILVALYLAMVLDIYNCPISPILLFFLIHHLMVISMCYSFILTFYALYLPFGFIFKFIS